MTSEPPVVKATALRMDAITDVAGIAAFVILVPLGGLDVYHAAGAIAGIVGLMHLDSVRKKGGAVVTVLGLTAAVAAKLLPPSI